MDYKEITKFLKKLGLTSQKMGVFFLNEFQLCLVGKADFKEELAKYLDQWNWQKSAEELISFWFEHESSVEKRILKNIEDLRSKGIKCYLNTNNEKYRVQYVLNILDLNKYFDGSFSSAELGYLKPQQEFWSKIYEQIGKPNKNEILVWDDDKENVESAQKFGFNSMLYSNFEEYEKYIKSLK